MHARYKHNEGSEAVGVVTSITFKRSEVRSLINELTAVLDVASDKDAETEVPTVSKLLRRMEELAADFYNDEDENEGENEDEDENEDGWEDDDDENFCSKCGTELD